MRIEQQRLSDCAERELALDPNDGENGPNRRSVVRVASQGRLDAQLKLDAPGTLSIEPTFSVAQFSNQASEASRAACSRVLYCARPERIEPRVATESALEASAQYQPGTC